MRVACVYWTTSSVGGIATHLNSLRAAAIQAGDTFDILHSSDWKKRASWVFPDGRKWVRGGDTRIWIDGEVEQSEAGRKFLEANYDAVLYGFICPHRTKAYPEPKFLPLYDVRLPRAAWVMDGYWDDYAEWAAPLLPKLRAVLCPLESYAAPLRELGVGNLIISAFPFAPRRGRTEPKATRPLLVWPCQHKEIKGVSKFLKVVPDLPDDVGVEIYSNGIRYYQLRTTDLWKNAVHEDKFANFNGTGRAVFYGNVDLPEIAKAYQRAWFTVNLQGMGSKRSTYARGSYNNTEVEALWYGACPVLDASTLKTGLPADLFIPVEKAEDIPGAVGGDGQAFALSPRRRAAAREFVRAKHLASARYLDVKQALGG